MKGIGFDATCSLAISKLEDGSPVSVTPGSWDGDATQKEGEWVRDIILWAGTFSSYSSW